MDFPVATQPLFPLRMEERLTDLSGRGIQQILELRSSSRIRRNPRLRLPTGVIHPGLEEHRRGGGRRVRLDEVEQRERLGSDETTSLGTPSSRGEPATQYGLCQSTGGGSRYPARATDTSRSPDKKRATPAPVAGQAGSKQNARGTRRVGRCAAKANKRGGRGTHRDGDTDSIERSPVPELDGRSPSSDQPAEPGHGAANEHPARPETDEHRGATFGLSEAHEDFLL